MNRYRFAVAALALALSLSPWFAQAQQTAASPERPPVTIQTSEAEGVKVFFLNMPWGPQTFAGMEKPGDGFYNRRTWPFARMQSSQPFTLEGTAVPPGNYALVFHPNTKEDTGMSLELRKIDIAEFLQAGNVMTATPEGVTLFKAPVRFDTATSTAPALKVDLAPTKDGVSLRVQYGDKLLERQFKR